MNFKLLMVKKFNLEFVMEPWCSNDWWFRDLVQRYYTEGLNRIEFIIEKQCPFISNSILVECPFTLSSIMISLDHWIKERVRIWSHIRKHFAILLWQNYTIDILWYYLYWLNKDLVKVSRGNRGRYIEGGYDLTACPNMYERSANFDQLK